MTKVHNAHKLGTINSGGPKCGASLCLTNRHISTILAANPARIQIIQAGQNEPSILNIGSQAVKKTGQPARTAAFRKFGLTMINLHLRKELNFDNLDKNICLLLV